MNENWTIDELGWAGRWAAVLSVIGFLASWFLTPLFGSWTGGNVGNLGPIPGLLFWAPLGLLGGGLLGWLVARLLSEERDVRAALLLVGTAYAVSAMLLPNLLAW